MINFFFERWIKFFKHFMVVYFTICNLIQFFFNVSSEFIIHNLWKVFKQEIVYKHCNIIWEKLTLISTGNFSFLFTIYFF